MLKQRVLTALLLLPVVIAAIFMLPIEWFIGLLAFIFLNGSLEYKRLAGLTNQSAGSALLFFANLYSRTLILVPT